MAVLNTLTFAKYTVPNNADPATKRRNKVLNKIDEQILLATDETYTPTKRVNTTEGSTPPPRTVSLSVVSDPLVVQPADAFSGCGIAQYNQRHHFAPRPALNSAGGEPGHA